MNRNKQNAWKTHSSSIVHVNKCRKYQKTNNNWYIFPCSEDETDEKKNAWIADSKMHNKGDEHCRYRRSRMRRQPRSQCQNAFLSRFISIQSLSAAQFFRIRETLKVAKYLTTMFTMKSKLKHFLQKKKDENNVWETTVFHSSMLKFSTELSFPS